MKLCDVNIGMTVKARTSGIHTGLRGKVLTIVDSKYEKGGKLVSVRWENGKILNWHPTHLEAIE